MRLGHWMGLTEEVSKRFTEEYRIWNTRPGQLVLLDRETLHEVQKRALRAIQRIEKESGEFPVLAVTHVAIIRCLMIHFQHLDINLYRRIDVPNVSIFCIKKDNDIAQISRVL